MYFGRPSSEHECRRCFKSKFIALSVNVTKITVMHIVQSKLQLIGVTKGNRWMGISALLN